MRLKRGLHQHQLAAKMDINQGRISEWENGVKPIPPERLEQAKTILN
jgi:transcriptional regulator with XRE-family HTH domain